MTTSNLSNISLAVLSASHEQEGVSLGILSAQIDLSPDADGWAQLLPAGYFSAVDGRPRDVPGNQWYLDGEIAERLIHQVRGLTNDRLIDYEHQTLKTEDNGQPAIASGWFNASEMEWREGDGLYIKPRWTDKAREHIKDDEYRYLSAVFPYDKNTGAPIALKMAALTNYPGLDGLQQVSALKGQFNNPPEETAMEQWLKDLLTSLGIDVEGDEISKEKGQAVLSAVKGLQTKAASAETLTDEVAVLKANAKSGEVNLSQYVPKALYDDAVVEVAALKAKSGEQSVEQMIDKAWDEGRIRNPAEKEYLTNMGKQAGIAALKADLESRAPIPALNGKQTDDLPDPKKPQDKDLNAEDLAVLKAIGGSKEEFLKAKTAE